MSSIDRAKLDSILTPQSSKIKNNVNKVLEYNLDVKDNINKLKETAGKYARKDINLGFIDRFSRWIYTNDKHLAKIEFIQYIIFIVILFIYNPFNINTKYPAFSKLLILIVAFMYVILFFFIKLKVQEAEDVDLIAPTEQTTLVRFFSIIAFFILFMIAIKGVMWILINTRLVKTIFRHLMSTCIIIGVLGIVYLFMRKTIDKAKNAKGKNFLKLILKIVMYLPCLLVDFVEYAKFQFNLTTKPVWILLGLEAGLVGLVFILPYVFDKILNINGRKLLNEPVNLNVETVVSKFNDTANPNNSPFSLDQLYSNKVNEKAQEELAQKGPNTLDNAPDKNAHYCDPNVPKNKFLAWIYNQFKHGISLKVDFSKHPQYADYNRDRFAYQYALSGWYYINPQPPNTSSAYSVYTNILNYGKKVQIEYNGKLNSLRVMAAKPSSEDSDTNNTSTEIYQTNDIMYQKWNNIVINYDGGEMDVFLNGVLVSSVTGAVPYMSIDTIVAGANNGIMGGICNINYYTDTLSEKTIKSTYKSLRIKNFPYI